MILLRSLLFQVLFYAWTAVLCVGYLPLLLGPRRLAQKAAAAWLRVSLLLLAVTTGLRYRVTGRENLPEGPVIVAAKHQSALETLIFHQVLDDPAYVLKVELMRIPLFGWYLRKTGNIAVDRAAGPRALKDMLAQARAAIARGQQLVIFPEGTRTAPGENRRYQPGVALLYESLNLPVVPVALNSGLFWRRRGVLKKPGTVTIEILPPLPPGMERRAFMERLQTSIEEASRRLADEAVKQGGARVVQPVDKVVDG